MQHDDTNLYSVIIPVYNSERSVRQTVIQVHDQLRCLKKRFEIILVNDGSTDQSWENIEELSFQLPEVTSIDLLKNYGQHHANLCGFRMAKGDYVITMDDDMQNPPEEISVLIEKIKEGYDLVLGNFSSKQHSLHRRLGSQLVGWLNRKIFKTDSNLVLSNYRIFTKNVSQRVCQDSSFSPYIPGLLLKYSNKQANVNVKHHRRAFGKSNYNWRRLINLVATLLFCHSSIPLRTGIVLGFFVSITSFLLSLYFLINAIIFGTNTTGWASIAVMLSFFNGILILLLSILGEYILRVLREINTQRSYEVRKVSK
jgi:glycosyltransferase involved in cell wall biosynthesis